jgi:hypothetical protein
MKNQDPLNAQSLKFLVKEKEEPKKSIISLQL